MLLFRARDSASERQADLNLSISSAKKWRRDSPHQAPTMCPHFEVFISVISFNSHSSPVRYMLLSPLNR